ncbi:hypothetical protein GPALN_012147 [Globodera pallida]|nr:hypothetical protein GPALN_012147 [Globodera pallida]
MAENIPPITNELESMEQDLLEGKRRQRNSHAEELKKDIAKMLAQLQNDMRADIQASVDGLWAKTKPLLAGQERATAALADALDECTENGAWAKKCEPDVETKSPSPVTTHQWKVESLIRKNRQTSPGLRDRGQSGAGPKGTWKKSVPKHQMRVGYLVRQLEREWKGPHAPQSCQWSSSVGAVAAADGAIAEDAVAVLDAEMVAGVPATDVGASISASELAHHTTDTDDRNRKSEWRAHFLEG